MEGLLDTFTVFRSHSKFGALKQSYFTHSLCCMYQEKMKTKCILKLLILVWYSVWMYIDKLKIKIIIKGVGK